MLSSQNPILTFPQLERHALRDAILLYALFGLATVALLSFSIPLAIGWRILLAVLLYNILLPFWARWRGYRSWWSIWTFLVPLSVLQIFPDWYLSTVLNVLVFPDTGAPFIGSVPVFMGGMWIIPLFAIVLVGQMVIHQFSLGRTLLVVALVSLVCFAGSEATLHRIPIWYAQHVHMLGPVAVYVILPEMILGVVTFLLYSATWMAAWWARLLAAWLIMILYLGSLGFFYLLFEHILVVGS